MWYPSRFIARSITFLIFVDDLQHVTKFLDPIMFADDTNLIYSDSKFEKVNKELTNVTDWCLANKLSINTSKTIFSSTSRSE